MNLYKLFWYSRDINIKMQIP